MSVPIASLLNKRVLWSKTYNRTKTHMIGHVIGFHFKENTGAEEDLAIVSFKGNFVTVPETQLVRILDWHCVNCPSGTDPFNPLDWMDKETTHWYNEENDWLLIRRPNENFMNAAYYQYLVKHPTDKNRVWYVRRSDIPQCNEERWV